MGRGRSGYLLCIPFISIVILLSWLLAVTLEHYSGHHRIFMKNDLSSKHLIYKNKGPPYPADRNENILIFLQISDIHISKFRYVDEIIPQLEDLCDSYIPIIKPKVVLVTGDLTDAKAQDNRKSQQYLDEWISYEKLIKKCRKKFNTTWLDVRGNHDDFGLPSHHSSLNMYKKFGSSHTLYGKSGTYQYVLQTKYGKYAFNGIDMAPNPGPKRPFNFFGVVEKEDLDTMDNMAQNAHLYNMSIWFGHYPISAVTTPSQVRNIIQQGTAYLCGHLHTLGGLVPNMYARPNQGHLELELGDWKENRRYRIIAIDHDIFSFTDVRHGTLPVILITNPKDARFQAPGREALERTEYSSHIRFLVFSKSTITKAKVLINNILLCENAKHVAGSLFVCPWDPNEYKHGINKIDIFVQDTRGQKTSKSMKFSLDGSIPLLDLIPGLIMLTNFCVLAKVMYFAVFLTFAMTPLLLRRVDLKMTQDRRWSFLVFPILIHRIHVFSKQDRIFWPLFYSSLYQLFGPLFIGELVPGSIGVCFVHGIYTNGHWLPGSLTYMYGALNIMLFNVPMMIYFGGIFLTKKESGRKNAADKALKKLSTIIFIFALLIQGYFSYIILICYGLMAFILCPVATWNVLLGIWLKYRI